MSTTSEAITWHDARVTLPDSDSTVLVHTRDESDPDPVWLGYHDGARWLSVDAWEIAVTHWAEMPQGPTPC